jgi:catechol 2,3-dioxygenase-like lactoylglutathione lyase family enzyme
LRLNHLDLHVPDVAQTRDFLVAYFGFKHLDTKGADALAILEDDAGFELVISCPNEKLRGADQATLGVNTCHIGFIVSERGDVDALHARLIAGGVELADAPKPMRGGWGFYVRAPGQILIEVSCRS